jgi:membrane protein YqaA with SNARE-associated domain
MLSEDKMSKIVTLDKSSGVREREWVGKRIIPILALLVVIAITVGLFFFYGYYPDKIEELKAYGYLGAFLISFIFNATIILPVGNIVVLSALGATLPSAAVVGLVGGAGAAVGEITGYIAGYSGRGFVAKSGLYSRVEEWVKRWGALTIFVLSLVPFIFDLAGIAAGALRFPFWRFIFLCWLGRTILYVTLVVLAAMGLKVLLPLFG